MSRKEDESGFSLLELLVAITILGLLIGLVNTGVGGAIRSFQIIDDETTKTAALSRSEHILRDRLARAFPILLEDDISDEPVLDFRGSSEGLRWRGILSPELGGAEAKFELYLDEGRLLLTVEGSNGAPEFEGFVLMTDIDALSFHYFGQSPEGAQWLEEWSEMIELPELVQIRFWRKSHDNPTVYTIAMVMFQ